MTACLLNMNGAKNVTATFQPQFVLTVDPPTGGTVTSDDSAINCGTGGSTCSAIYTAGAVVTLTATPDPLDVLAHWGNDCAAADPTSTCTVTMNSAHVGVRRLRAGREPHRGVGSIR